MLIEHAIIVVLLLSNACWFYYATGIKLKKLELEISEAASSLFFLAITRKMIRDEYEKQNVDISVNKITISIEGDTYQLDTNTFEVTYEKGA